MGSSSGSGGKTGTFVGPRLVLRFSLPGLSTDEVYVARKLTIGRTPDNVFVIPEDAVDRHHAVVDYCEEKGQFVVRCLQRDGYLDISGQQVHELMLQPGVRFRIGSGEFECLAAPEVTSSREERNWSLCPFCRSERCGELALGTGSCPSCHRDVMVAQDGLGRRVVIRRRVQRCRLVRLVGQGGMTWVFEGQTDGQKDPVAIKILMPHLLNDDAALQRFKRESEILRQIQHPRVLRRLGQGRWNELPCVLTPLMRGGSLRGVLDQLRRQKQICSFEVALRWFLDVMEGLDVLHQLGLVHRDLKPSNILLDGANRVVVGDLGIVRRLGQETASLTATGAALGTYHYMAPEQWDNPERVDQRADLYALGCTFYELLTGRLPTGRWQDPSQINPTVPPAFDGILERLLEHSPQRRFDSVASLRRALLETGLIGPAEVAEGIPDRQACGHATCLPPQPAPPAMSQSVLATVHQQEQSSSSSARATPFKGPTSLPDLAVKHSATSSVPPSATHPTPRPIEGILQQSRDVCKAVAAGLCVCCLVVLVLLAEKWAASPRIPKVVVSTTGQFSLAGSVAFSPDGRQVLTGGGTAPGPFFGGLLEKTPRLWDVATGRELRRFEGHTASVRSVAFSPDGRQVLTGSYDNTARLWDVATGKELRRFEGHIDTVSSVAFSPDGRQVLTGSYDNTARLWDVATGKELRRFEGHIDTVSSVAFSPNGQQILTGSYDNTARLWDVATGKELRRFDDHTGTVTSVAFSPHGWDVLTGAGDNTAKLWDVATGQELRRFQGHTASVRSVAFSPDGRQVLTGSDDKTARLWDVATGKELRRFEGHIDTVSSVAFSPDGRQILTGSCEDTARLWDVATGKQLRRFQGRTAPVFSVAFSPDGGQVLMGSGSFTGGASGSSARLWDVATGKELRRFGEHTAVVWSVAFSPDGRQVVTGSYDNTARLWDVPTGQELRRFEGHIDMVSCVAFSPDGRWVLTGSDDKTVRLWDVATGKELRRFEGHTNTVWSVAFSPDGQQVLTGSWDETARLWDVATGKEVRRFEGHTAAVWPAAFSPDGRLVLTGAGHFVGVASDNTARLWDVATGQELRRFEGHIDMVSCVAFSPDGRWVLTGSDDKTVRLWDVATGKELRRFEGHTDTVSSVAFSPNGRRVVTGSLDNTARLWDAATGRELCRFYGLTDGYWLVLTPEGYFNSDISHPNLLPMTYYDPITGQDLPMDEVVRRYHRPDLVRAKLGG